MLTNSSKVPMGKLVFHVLAGIRYLVPENPTSPGEASGEYRYLSQVPVFSGSSLDWSYTSVYSKIA